MDDTPTLRRLRNLGVERTEVRYGPVGLVAETAAVCDIEVRDLVKIIVVRRGAGDYVFVLMPGNREFSRPRLRTLLGVFRFSMPDAAKAKQATGYERGTTTPFGASHP